MHICATSTSHCTAKYNVCKNKS